MRTLRATILSLAALGLLVACPAPTAPVAAVSHEASKQIPVGKSPHGMWAANGFVYNSNVGDGTISVIDAATEAVVKTLTVENGNPGYIKPFHDERHVLILDTKQGQLMVVETTGHTVVQTVALGGGPDKIAVSDDDTQVMITLTAEPKALLLTFGTDRTQAPARHELAVGTVGGAGEHKHRAIALSAGWAVVPSSGENQVQLIDVAAKAVKTVQDGNEPGPVAVGTKDGQALVAIVGNKASNTVTLYDLPSGEKTTLSDVGLAPTDIAVDAALGRAFVTMAGSNEVTAIDYLGKQVLAKLPVGQRPVHLYLAPETQEAGQHRIWVGNDASASVSVIDGEALKVLATVATGEGHHKMAFANGKAFVSNITANNVSVVDMTAIR